MNNYFKENKIKIDTSRHTELPTNCVTFFREALSIPSRFLVT